MKSKMALRKPLSVYFGLLVLAIVLIAVVTCEPNAEDSKNEGGKDTLGTVMAEVSKAVDKFMPSGLKPPNDKQN